MSTIKPTLEDVLAANRLFHDHLAKNGHYQKQPFYHPQNQQRIKKILQQLQQQTGGKRLLDVGCGTGFIIDLASDYFENIVGVDANQQMLNCVQKKSHIELVLAEAEDLPFAGQSFDVVTCHGVLHHIFDLSPVLLEIRRVIKPQGIVYIDESPNAYCFDALKNLAISAENSDLLKTVHANVTNDKQRYLEHYNLEPKIVESAMHQTYQQGGINADQLALLLKEKDFIDVQCSYRWFLGENKFDRATAVGINNHLQTLLPLTRHLFKYIQCISKASQNCLGRAPRVQGSVYKADNRVD